MTDEWVVVRVRDRTYGSREYRQERSADEEVVERFDDHADALDEKRALESGCPEPGVNHLVRPAAEAEARR